MAVPFLGRNLRIALGEETTWGTEVARTATGRGVSCSLQRRASHVPLPHLVSALAGGANRSDLYQADERVEGAIQVVAAYESNLFGLLARHGLGAVADAGGGPTYTHTFTIANALPAGLTVEVLRGSSAITEEFTGVKIKSWKLSVEAGKPAMIDVEFVGETGNARATASPAAPALVTHYPILHHHLPSLSFNAVTYVPRKVVISHDNKLDTGLHELGSLYISEPDRGDYCDTIIEAELVYRSDTLYVAHLGQTQGNVTGTFTDPAASRSLAITGHNAILEKCEDPISAAGYVTQSVRWRCYADGTNGGLAMVLTNALTTGILS